MISKTNQRLILNLDDIKAAAAEKLPAKARGEVEHASMSPNKYYADGFFHWQSFTKLALPTKSR